MNIFAWLFLAFAGSFLICLLFLTIKIAIDIRTARKRTAPPIGHPSLFFGRAPLGRWRAWRKHSPERIQSAAQSEGSVGPRGRTKQRGRPLRQEPESAISSPGTALVIRRQEVEVMNHCNFHYSYLLPRKPGIPPLQETMTKQCRRCGAEFVTRSRVRKRCEPCQTVVSVERQKKANERSRARRAARRLRLLKAS
jgi:hypothetical protein